MINIEKYVSNLSNNKKIKLNTTIKTLKQVEEVINYHNNHYETNDSAIILSIFGLLQSIFVGIDSLYNLTLSLTKNKSNINLNHNITLNKLKFIRNDIVGHPINRKYGTDSVGYSLIKLDNLNYNYFEYITYLEKGNKLTENFESVDLTKVKEEYLKEQNIILNQITYYINNKDIKTNIYNLIVNLYNESNLINLNLIKEVFYETYGKQTNNRFIWRLELVEHIIKNNYLHSNLADIFNYILTYQLNKLISINNSFENKSNNLFKLDIPSVYKNTYKYLNKNKEYIEYIKHLHDINSTYFNSDLDYLLNNVKDDDTLTLLKLINSSKDRNLIYLIGSSLKLYKN